MDKINCMQSQLQELIIQKYTDGQKTRNGELAKKNCGKVRLNRIKWKHTVIYRTGHVFVNKMILAQFLYTATRQQHIL